MAHQRTPRLGLLELGGIGFAVGTSGGTVAGLLSGGLDEAVSCGGAIGAVLLPVLWFGVARPASRAWLRLAARRVRPSQGARVTA